MGIWLHPLPGDEEGSCVSFVHIHGRRFSYSCHSLKLMSILCDARPCAWRLHGGCRCGTRMLYDYFIILIDALELLRISFGHLSDGEI